MKKINHPKALAALAPELRQAIAKLGRHVPCPLPEHENSKDGFRLFPDFKTTGGGCCNSCGFYPNGTMLLAKLKGISTKQAYKLLIENS